jgi:CPA1 family monovalent cation:H+ antiporter
MGLMVSTLILLLTAVISIFISQVFPKISGNYISMISGAVIFFFPIIRNNIEHFNSDIFLGLIIAPLLFFEGQSMHLNFVGQELKHIFQMTVSLVLLCLVVSGFSVWWLAGISMPLAFILAAVSTPTDATAMESVTNELKMPATDQSMLKMESLFNDASGIILLNMAALWYVNGYINYSETIENFLISAVGGALFGFVGAWVVVLARQQLLRTAYTSLNAQILIYIVTPFILYYLAEMIHVSGIITVVCAGMVHNAEAQRSRLLNSRQIHFSFDLVAMITEIFNSMVFVILGFMFVSIVVEEKSMVHSLNWLLIGTVLYVVNTLIRYGYSRVRLQMTNKDAWIFSLGGVHGAVTLALAYTVAEMHVKSGAFNLVLLSASFLIILSMVVPTIAFRFLLNADVPDKEILKEVDQIRVKMVHQAVAAVNRMYLPANVKKSVIFDLMTQKQMTRTRDFVKAWYEVVRHPEFTGAEKELEMRAFMNAFLQERQYLDMISQSEVRYQKCVYQLYNEVLLAESLVVGPNVFEEN